jgi:dipeptidyl aminopeptidase/acylaminoacyl peptidase
VNKRHCAAAALYVLITLRADAAVAGNYVALSDPLQIPPALPGPKRGMTVEDQMRIRRIDSAILAPDGSQILVQLRQADAASNSFYNAWFVVPIQQPGGARYLANAGDVNVFQSPDGSRVGEITGRPAMWSPDGRWIAYGKQEQSQLQIWLVPAEGGAARQLTHNTADVMEFVWRPDGKALIFTVGRDRTALARDTDAEALQGYRYDDRIRPEYPSEVAWPTCAKERFVEIDPKYRCEPTTWFIDVSLGSERRATDVERKLFEQRRSISEMTRLIEADTVQLLTPSPNGKPLAWIENVDPSVYVGWPAPMVVTASADAERKQGQRCRCEECSGSIEGLWWNAAGDELVFQKDEGHGLSLTSFYAWKPGSTAVRQLLSSDAAFHDCSRAPGDRLICTRADWTHPPYLVALNMRTGQCRTVFEPNPEFKNFQFTKIEKLEWRDANGNDALGHFVYPAGYQPGKRYPVVVVGYGFRGFIESVGDEHAIFPMAQQGLAVLFYSIPFTQNTKKIANIAEANAEDWKTSRAKPLNWALDELDRRGLIDTAHVGISGLSNGATMVDEAILNTQRFAAASAGYSGTHPVGYYLLPATFREAARMVSGGEPLGAGLPYWQAHSPGMNAGKIHTPLLLNVADREVMLAVANYVSLQDAGKAVDFYIYPDEYHVKWQPAHKYAVFRRNLQWFQFWLQGVEAADPVDPEQYPRWRRFRDTVSSVGSRQ